MKDIYFIDNESIKRTAKSIQKNNPTFKYTIILDDIAQLLGYTSYNQYEHYLTNVILSPNSSLDNIKALTKINLINLLLLQKSFTEEFSNKGYVIDDFYFMTKLLSQQKRAFIDHSYLNLYAYLCYLPFVFEDVNNIDDKCINDIKNQNFTYIIQLVIDYYKTIDLNNINQFIHDLKDSIEQEINSDIFNNFELLNKDLKTRGLYYYIKSVIEDFDYDEGFLTSLIVKGYSLEKIEHELRIRIREIPYTEQKLPVFFQEDKSIRLQNYFPFIKESISEKNPLIFGKNKDRSPFFATHTHLHSNISLLGVPGSGKGTFLYTFLFQLMMNNRGFCILNTAGETYLDKHVKYMATSLNKKYDILSFNKESSPKAIASAIHNEKLILAGCGRQDDRHKGIDVVTRGSDRLEEILLAISHYFFTAKFRNKKLPFYIVIEEACTLTYLTPKTIDLIRTLNALNIFFLFDNQVHERFINDLCDVTLVTNSSIHFFKNSKSFEFSKIMTKLNDDSSLLGKMGPSLKLAPVFSLLYKDEYIGQFITEIDDDLFSQLRA